jgi:23S rRNA (adenine2030-N6)-methyltransferase
MNYRHAFHAGNFADVLKHAALAFCLRRLAAKEKAFAALDTHAGVGWYDLEREAARRSPEWRDGIGRLWDGSPPEPAHALLGPYLDAMRAFNAGGALRRYPGSPALLAELARPRDAIALCELHPDDARTLALRFETDPRVRVETCDGYGALKALLPPKERRGLVLVDPPFEEKDEWDRLAKGLRDGLTRWSTGTFIVWRPLKDGDAAERFDAGLANWLIEERATPPERLLRADLSVRRPAPDGPLAGAGIVVVNPPFGLEPALAAALPWLAEQLAQGEGGGWRLDRVTGPSAPYPSAP